MNNQTNDAASSNDGRSAAWDEFLAERRLAISNAYISCDADPLWSILTTQEPATFFPPNGQRVSGAAAVAQAQLSGAASFAPGSEGRFEILASGTSGGLAWWAGAHRATVHLVGKDDPVDMTLRTSEVFRFEEGEWKLVHRHADMLGND